MGKSQILIVPKIWWLDLEEWAIQDKMIRELFAGVYVTKRVNPPKWEKKLIAYMRVDPSRPSVAVIQKNLPYLENIGLKPKMGLSSICMKG